MYIYVYIQPERNVHFQLCIFVSYYVSFETQNNRFQPTTAVFEKGHVQQAHYIPSFLASQCLDMEHCRMFIVRPGAVRGAAGGTAQTAMGHCSRRGAWGCPQGLGRERARTAMNHCRRCGCGAGGRLQTVPGDREGAGG